MSENICSNYNDDEIQVLPHLAAKTNFFGLRVSFISFIMDYKTLTCLHDANILDLYQYH